MEPQVQPWTVEIEVTTSGGWPVRSSVKADMQPWKVKSLLEDLRRMGVKGVVFHGTGDPALWLGGVVVEHIRNAGEWCQAALYTIAAPLPKDLSWMKKCTFVCVVWAYPNQVTPRNITRMLSYKKTEPMHCLVNVKIPLDKDNYTRVQAIYGEVKALEPDYILLWPIGLSEDQIRELTYLIRGTPMEKDETCNSDIILNMSNPVLGGMSSEPTGECWAILRGVRAYVTADGNVYVCPETIGDTKFQIGNIYRDDFPEIWSGDRHLSVISELTCNLCFRGECRLREYDRVLDKFHMLKQTKGELGFPIKCPSCGKEQLVFEHFLRDVPCKYCGLNLPWKEEYVERVGGIL